METEEKVAGVLVVNNDRKKIISLLLILCMLTLLFHPMMTASASTDTAGAHELILLFDTSASMAQSDPANMAPDAFGQIMYSLPSFWHIGLVAFDTEITSSIAPAANMREQINTALGNTSYSGQANIDTGLQYATQLFSENALSRTLILMTNAQLSENGHLSEDISAQVMESNVRLHTILLGSNFDIFQREEISQLTENTGGVLFENVPPEGLASVAIALVFHQNAFFVAATLVDTAEGDDGNRSLSIDLPVQGLSSVQILMLSLHGVREVNVEGGFPVDIQYGEIFTTAAIRNPQGQTLELEIVAPDVREVFVFFEWDLQIMAEWSDSSTARIWLENTAGQNVLLDPIFADISSISVLIDGTYTNWLPLESGYLTWQLGAGERIPRTMQVFLDEFSIHLANQEGNNLPVSFVGTGTVIDGIAGLLTMRNAYIAICAFAVLALILLIYIRFARRAKMRAKPAVDTKLPPTTMDKPVPEPVAAVMKTPIAPTAAKPPVQAPEIGADIVLKTPIVPTAAPKPAATAPAAQPTVAERPVRKPAAERPIVKPQAIPVKPQATRPTTAQPQPARSAATMVKKSVGGTFAFSGKVDVYVNKITTGKSDTTLAYRLIRMRGKRKHSLQAIISKNQIKQHFPSIDRIYFAVNAQGALEVTHDLDRAIMIGEHALIKGHNHVWEYGEKLNIPCEKGERELVVSPTFMYRPR